MRQDQRQKKIYRACELLETRVRLMSCVALGHADLGSPIRYDTSELVKEYGAFYEMSNFAEWGPMDTNQRILMLLLFLTASADVLNENT
jgi:hypothetical protein